jgi:alpha-1,2-mannosyltransferase
LQVPESLRASVCGHSMKLVSFVALLVFFVLLWVLLCHQLVDTKLQAGGVSIGFLHPSCAGGGGGERVLWCAVRAFLHKQGLLSEPGRERAKLSGNRGCNTCVWVYTSRYQPASKSLRSFISARAAEQFGAVAFDDAIRMVRFMPLRTAALLEPRLYPCFTMFLQLLVGALIAAEIVLRHTTLQAQRLVQVVAGWPSRNPKAAQEPAPLPSIILDTVGIPLSLLCLKCWTLGRIRTCAYVHYPLVSSEMMSQAVARLRVGLKSIWAAGRLVYYRYLLLQVYAGCGAATDLVMVNSSWTREHMKRLWHRVDDTQSGCTPQKCVSRAIHLVYPPCGPCRTRAILPALGEGQVRQRIVSIAQFRPEKRHQLQLECFTELLHRYPRETLHARLVMMGGARNQADRRRAARLCQQAAALRDDLCTEDRVQIRVNVHRDDLERALHGEFGCFLHTMEDEHFGISIVEAMSSGLIVITHASGGALHDILCPESPEAPLGFLYRTRDELIERMADVLFRLPVASLQAIQTRACKRARTMFSDEAFHSRFLDALASLTVGDSKHHVSKSISVDASRYAR